jgi:hypothetical protein
LLLAENYVNHRYSHILCLFFKSAARVFQWKSNNNLIVFERDFTATISLAFWNSIESFWLICVKSAIAIERWRFGGLTKYFLKLEKEFSTDVTQRQRNVNCNEYLFAFTEALKIVWTVITLWFCSQFWCSFLWNARYCLLTEINAMFQTLQNWIETEAVWLNERDIYNFSLPKPQDLQTYWL